MPEALYETPARLLHSIVHRPYVFIFLFVHLLLGALHLGLTRILCFTAVGYAIAWTSELASIHTGFPYGLYRYLPSGLEGDLTVLGVPFFDSISYTFLAYFSWTTAIAFTSPIHVRDRLDIQLAETPKLRGSWRVLVLSALLMTWVDIVVDPVARLGDRWFLGKIYEYEHPGAYFGVPVSNFAGWFFVAFSIVGAYQVLDRRLGHLPSRGERRVYAQGVLGPLVLFGVVIFNLAVTFWLGETGLGLAGCFIFLPIVFLLALRVADPTCRARDTDLREAAAAYPDRPL